MVYYAHTAEDADGNRLAETSGRWQPLAAHLKNVAALARDFATPLGLGAEAEMAGLIHDLGKYAERFQARLRKPALVHGVNHWAAGTVAAIEGKLWPVAFAVDGHHTGIPALRGAKSLEQTRERFRSGPSRKEFTQCSEALPELLSGFLADGLTLPSITPQPVMDRFAEALRTRLLFSCLVDADFLDTEAHFKPAQVGQRNVPNLEVEHAWHLLQAHLSAKPNHGPVNALRRQLLQDCLDAAEKPPGLFTLTAPTGSGKTLASLAFALRHILHHNAKLETDSPQRFRRIIVVIPYTSIIEQTARVYRDLFEEAFGPDYVLEHHSAVGPRKREEESLRDAEDVRLQRARLASENWASPLVVTTSVQFFESLFANRPSDCRKLHHVGRSVVLFDEVQTLPSRLVPSLLSAIRLLSREPYGATAVFMTATQPAFGSIKPGALPYGWQPVEVSSNPEAIAETLRRTSIELPASADRMTWPEVAEKLAAERQALCVVNTTRDARALFRLLPAEHRFHLSARMCPAHRLEKLTEIRRRLDPAVNAVCLLVSTQLIEAGVDIDFPIALRALGPLDSIIQTAGRCNREGRSTVPCPVIVFRPLEGGSPRGAYKIATQVTEAFLARHPNASERLHQPAFYAEYFAELYSLLGPQAAQQDTVFADSEKFDFPAADEACQLVGENSRRVLVRWGEGAALAEKLAREKYLTAGECRLAQRYSVSLYEGELKSALPRGIVFQPTEDWNLLVWNSFYDKDLGACDPEAEDFVC